VSRYEVPAKDVNHNVVVGWDAPLNTYFAHVIDTLKDEDDRGRDVLWIGTTPGEIFDVAVVVRQVQPYVKRPADIPAVGLYRDANE